MTNHDRLKNYRESATPKSSKTASYRTPRGKIDYPVTPAQARRLRKHDHR
jgi:hypothetical protein